MDSSITEVLIKEKSLAFAGIVNILRNAGVAAASPPILPQALNMKIPTACTGWNPWDIILMNPMMLKNLKYVLKRP